MNMEQEKQKKKPYKILGLSMGKKKTGGRNNQGRITAFHRGGGNKLRYIYINQSTAQNASKRNGLVTLDKGVISNPVYNSGEVRYLVRDPNRTAWIAGIYWSANKEWQKASVSNSNLWYSYYSNRIAPEGLNLGSTVTDTTALGLNGDAKSVQASLLTQTIGNKSYLKDLMIGTIVHNLDNKYIRAAGCSGIIISKVQDPSKGVSGMKVTVKLQSGQYKVFSGETFASIGVISNGEHKTKDYRKAGQRRWLGRRPIVRGVAMNPIDHPHGGGEGKSSGGRPSVTPWGKPTKGKPTRSPKKPSLTKVRG